jgi:hypothetical protein
MSKEVVVDIKALPELHDTKQPFDFIPQHWRRTQGFCPECDSNFCYNLCDHMQFWIRLHLTYFIWGVVISIVAIAAILIVISASNSSTTSPCLKFDSNTLASQLTVECLNYVWAVQCQSRPYTFPSDYKGFWNQSPQGATLLMCPGGAFRSPNCGVGSYGNLIPQMARCDISMNH